ncbi:putative protein OS=Tsukamurella paurometabola (strain ATCC 8368 / DSM / CCUG 35730 /CIP 100753 / JCM 10117 / KCTC 9821 / NBRC 16120 / NCIMB 702349/ NCTC 13040) OX=521096 GN=Tpau_4125 PE=4 SV=1 [Tsukamurella paurometabola]|uniref:Uncharacterized protein n=1 Tax=Tsukamurella paurometabola (strain ATCC 8368 / DSM 20162 / CCUG 35730 / CIP 100753 / JCM 10117 / KCTC 9821 / NBRC 16120 / NCIMB 702349 / NCTC 13040) TaxID=521096 RepID=D5UNY5_TSUPD|nr:DUF2255 family protein [Tsukamurella paurometabola]ADG80694.1 conserved hypothetical protein [Tsukamurella paurometabola DSM 20162]SUP40600.1 PPOX class probable F420-dependent enzyme, Rv2061 family [Tsukamurella paurometabola]
MTTAEALAAIDRSEVVQLTTMTRDGRAISTPVGATVTDGVVYIRSQRRAKGLWYRRALNTPRGTIEVGPVALPVTFAHVDDVAELRRLRDATLAKYGGALRSLLLRPALWWTRDVVIRATPA